MANLIRTTTLERGHDPRAFSLVAFGGAGPLHVGGYGSALGFEEALIPPSASVLSALGLATADHRRTYRRSLRRRLPIDAGELTEAIATLEREAASDLARSGLDARLETRPWVAMRYRRQTHLLPTPVERTVRRGRGRRRRSVPHSRHASSRPSGRAPATQRPASRSSRWASTLSPCGRPVRPAPGGTPRRRPSATPGTSRPVWFGGWLETAVLDGGALEIGVPIEGPAIVTWGATSVVVAPDRSVTVDPDGILHLRLGEGGA